MQVFSRALNVSEAELFKLMEQGKLVSSEVLPKVAAELRKSALAGGAYELALKGLRVTEGQFLTETTRAGNTIFKSGFSAGLSELYETLSETLKDSGPQLEKIGKIFGVVFKTISKGIEVVAPLMRFFIDHIEVFLGLKVASTVATMSKAFGGLGAAIRVAFAPLAAGLFVMEEIASLMSDKLVGNLEAAAGMQFNMTDGSLSNLVKDKDGDYIKSGKTGTLFGGNEGDAWYEGALRRAAVLQNPMLTLLSARSMMNGSPTQAAPAEINITNNVAMADASQVYEYQQNQIQMHMANISK